MALDGQSGLKTQNLLLNPIVNRVFTSKTHSSTAIFTLIRISMKLALESSARATIGRPDA
jgi:hypothetical protein